MLITAGHLFAPIVDESILDISSTYTDIIPIANYQNAVCNDETEYFGEGIGGLNVHTLGSSYNMTLSSSYVENEDYAVLQSQNNIDDLADYNIDYAGWSVNYNLASQSNTGYTSINHPKGDVKKICLDNSYAHSTTKNFSLYFDIGIIEAGSSGGPIYNSQKQVVGLICLGFDGNGCQFVGQTVPENRVSCGNLSIINNAISSYLDPNNTGEAESSNPTPPTPPAHCNNCVLDGDETGLDCGGSCYPCGMQAVVTLKTHQDMPSKTVQSRYELFAEPDPNTLLTLKSGTYTFEAGLNVTLDGGFEVTKGVNFSADVEQELMTEPDRGCQSSCFFPANVFTPNGDGINDYWGFTQSFISSYSIEVFNEWDQLIYSNYNQPVYQNEPVLAWDGTGITTSTTYQVGITYYDCNGNSHISMTYVSVFGAPASLENEEDILTNIKEEGMVSTQINVYPNPFKNKFIISYSGNEFPFEYKVMDINGQVIISETSKNRNETVDLSKYVSGTYIINVKAENYNLVQKLIKN